MIRLEIKNYNTILTEKQQIYQHRKRLKIITPKQMLERLPITLAQVKAGNTSQNLLNEISQIIYSFY